MNIVKANQDYEKWLRAQLRQAGLQADTSALAHKRGQMARDPFRFLRATFYRWVQNLPEVVPAPLAGPVVRAVGDLHLENFGTWRDDEGRLIWGINDFDEAAWLPYTSDLLRLATSTKLAIEAKKSLPIGFNRACGALLQGYTQTLESGSARARPIVLGESNGWLRDIAARQLDHPAKFWSKFEVIPAENQANRGKSKGEVTSLARGNVPAAARSAIEGLLPPSCAPQWGRRRAGLGSLGRPRIVAVTDWQGGRMAREAKAIVPSAVHWAEGVGQLSATEPVSFQAIMGTAIRCSDPLFHAGENWTVRRLAPDCDKLDLTSVSPEGAREFFCAMGRETANIHLGTTAAVPAILEHLKAQPDGWLRVASLDCWSSLVGDWKEWRAHQRART